MDHHPRRYENRSPKVLVQYKPPSVTLDDVREVFVTHVSDPGNFHVQYVQKIPELNALMEQLQQYCSDPARLQFLNYYNAGQACLIWFSKDKLWYRSIITGLMQASVEVLFVDYGNREMVPQQNVVEIIPEFMELEVQAVGCSMAYLKSQEMYWLPEHTVQIEDCLLNRSFNARFIGLVNNDIACEVELTNTEGRNINQEFGHMTNTYNPPMNVNQIRHKSGSDSRHSEGRHSEGKQGPPSHKSSEPRNTPTTPNHGDGKWASGFQNSPTANTDKRNVKPATYKMTTFPNGTEVDILVSFVNSPHEFYCQELIRASNLEQMMDRLDKFYNNTGAVPFSQIHVHDVAALRYTEDRRWYRVKVVRFYQGNPEVQFVDYGNYEVVNPMSLKVLNRDFLELPEQAVCCSLSDVEPVKGGKEWTDDEINAFSEIASDEEMKIIVSSSENAPMKLHRVHLRKPSVPPSQTVNNELIKLGHAKGTRVIASSPPPARNVTSPSSRPIPPRELPKKRAPTPEPTFISYATQSIAKNTKEQVVVCWFNNPGDFSCQLVSQETQITGMMSELQTTYVNSTFNPSETFIEGSSCVSKFDDDGMWYRVVVTQKKPSNKSSVMYIDYGNEAVVDNSNLRAVLTPYTTSPILAVRCKLNLEPPSDKWSAKANTLFESVIADQCTCTFIEKQGGFYVVDIVSNGISVTDMLLSRFEARGVNDPVMPLPKTFPKLDVNMSSPIKVYVSHVESANNFYIQFSDSTPVIDKLLDDLAVAYETAFLPLPSPEIGSPCVAKFAEDEAFYRGKIIRSSTTSDGFQVLFVDYGNGQVSQAADLQRVVPSLITVPEQTIHCTLRETLAELTDKFNEMTTDKELKCRVIRKAGEMYEIDLFDGDVDVCKKLSSSLIKDYPEQTDLTGCTKKGFISHLVSPEDFHLHISGCEEKLEAMSNKCQTLSSQAVAIDKDQVKPNAVVLAKYSFDDLWYRGRVKKVQLDMALVNFVDFGNTEMVKLDNLRKIGPELVKDAPIAYHCSLTSAKSGSKEAIAVIEEITQDKELTCVFTTSNSVWIYVDKTSCTQSLVSQHLCTMSDERYPFRRTLKSFKGYISHVDSECVYVQNTDITETLDKITEALETQPPSTPTTNYECCSKYSEDGAWYRSIIESIDSSGFHVRFIDFGNGQVCQAQDVVETPETLCGISPCAIKCKINGKDKIPQKLIDGLVACEEELTVNVIAEKNDLYVTLSDASGKDITKVNPDPVLALPKPKVFGNMQGYVSEVDRDGLIFVQLCSEEDKLTNMTEKLVDLSAALSQQEPPEDIQVGHYVCCQFTEDDAWYRAIVTSITAGKVTVRFVDFGNLDTVVVQTSVRDLPPELTTTSPLALKCQLSKTDNLSIKDLEDLKLCDSEITIQFMTDSEPFVVKLPSKAVATTDVASPDVTSPPVASTEAVGATPQQPDTKQAYIDQKCPEGFVTGAISEIDGLFMYVQLDSEFDNLQKLADDLQSFDDHFKKEHNRITDFTIGTPCCSIFSEDDAWYRGRIVESSGDNVVVRFIDYGNKETIAKTSVHPVPDELLKQPAFAYPCLSSKDGNLAIESPVTIKFTSQTAPYMVAVKSENGTIIESETVHTTPQKQVYPEQITFPDYVTGAVSEIESDTVYIQLDSQFDALQKLADDLQAFDGLFNSGKHSLNDFSVGTPCCTKFSLDEAWYRGVVDDTADDKVTVRFIDYGNKETTSKSSVYSVPEGMLAQPAFAYPCRLPKDSKLVVENPVEMKFTSQLPPYRIQIKGEGDDVVPWKDDSVIAAESPQVISQQKQEYPKQVTFFAYMPGLVSEIEYDIAYIQLDSEFDSLQKIADTLQEFDGEFSSGKYTLRDFSVGTPCCAKFSDDGAWYRGVIDREVGDHVTVRFIDYGNKETMTIASVHSVPESMLAKPAFAYACRLPKDFTFAVGSLIQVKITSDDPPYFADIMTPGEQLTSSQWHPGVIYEYPKQETFPEFVTGAISEIENTIAYIQLDSQFDALQKMADDLQAFDVDFSSGNHPLTDFVIGTPCCTKFSEDEAWYRGEIDDMVDDKITVRFIDYGNKETTAKSSVCSVPRAMRALAPFAYPCALPKDSNFEIENLVEIKFTSQTYNRPYMVAMKTPDGNIVESAPLPKQQYPQQTIFPGFEKGKVSEIDDNTVYVQLQSQLSALQLIATELQSFKWDFKTVKHSLTNFDIGSACCARFSRDNAWYRGMIEDYTKDGDCVIRFVDNGNKETVKKPALNRVPNIMLSQPPFAYPCIIPPDTTLNISDDIVLKVVSEETPYTINIWEVTRPDSVEEFPEPDFPVKTFIECVVSIIDNDIAYIHMKQQDEERCAMEDDIQSFDRGLSSGSYSLKYPKVGSNCCIKLPTAGKSNWYRGKVEQVEGDKLTVRTIDHGQQVVVKRSDVCSLPAKFIHKIPFAHPCSLTPNSRLSEGDQVEVEFLSKSPPYRVNIKTLNGAILESPMVYHTESQRYKKQSIPDELCGGSVSEVDNDVVYINLDSQLDQLQLLADQLQLYEDEFNQHKLPLLRNTEGTVCCCKFSEDDAWYRHYRAIIESVTDKDAVVRFVDYGNKETVLIQNLHALPTELLSNPPFAYPCKKEIDMEVGGVVNIKFYSDTPPYKIIEASALSQEEPVTEYLPATIPSTTKNCVIADIDENIAYIQLESSFTALEELAETLQTYSDSFKLGMAGNAATELPVNSPCCALFSEDNAWYRGIIEKITEDNKLSIRFVDYGNKEVVEKSAIVKLPHALATLPPYAYPCLKDTHELEIGSTLSIKLTTDKPPYGIDVCAADYSSHVIPSDYTSGVISDIDSHMYIQLDSQFEQLEKLAEDLQNFVDHFTSQENVLSPVTIGMPCCCIFSEDESWYRGKVEEIIDDSVVVRFVDYGNKETVQKGAVFSLPGDMRLKPPFSYPCVLRDNMEVGAELKFKLTNKDPPFTILLDGEPDPNAVSEPDGSTDNETAPTTSYPTRHAPDKPTTCEIMSIDPNGLIHVQIDSPEFYAVTDSLFEMDSDLNTSSEEMSIAPNTPCCVKSQIDDCWYRAIVVKITDDDKVKVRHVDFGSSELVTRHGIKAIPTDLLQSAPFTITAKLKGVVLDKDDIEKIVEATDGKPVLVEFLSTTEPFDVKISLENEDISDMLFKETTEAQYRTSRMEVGEKHEVFITHCVSPDLFWCQRATMATQLEILMTQVSEYCSQTSAIEPSSDLDNGSPCVAKFSDQEWYRGIIVTKKALSFDVQFIDYGNTESVENSHVLPIPSKLTTLPRQSMECSLSGVIPVGGEWTEEAREYYKTNVADKKLLLEVTNVKAVDDNIGYSVTMLDMGMDVRQGLVDQGHAIRTETVVKSRLASSIGDTSMLDTSTITDDVSDTMTDVLTAIDKIPTPKYKHDQLSTHKRLTVYISHVLSPSQFYIQKQPNDQLESLMEQLSEYYSSHECPIDGELTKNTPYVVYYEDISETYRVLVQKQSEGSPTVEVLYVDYGEIVTVPVSQLHAMAPQFLELPIQAYECGLTGVRSQGAGWSDDAKDAFSQMVSERTLIADVLAAGHNSYMVHLLDMGLNLHEIMIEQGLGVPASSPLPLPDNIQRVFNTPVKEKFRRQTSDTDVSVRFTETLYNIGDRFTVTVSHVETPWWFACQPSATADDLHLMTSRLQREHLLAAHLDLDSVQIGQICMTKTGDDTFYRSVVKTVNKSDVCVYLVDIGEHKLVTISEIYAIEPEFTQFPQQAFCCSLNGVKPKDIDWEKDTIERFKGMVKNKVELLIKSVNKGGLYNVILSSDDGNVNENLLESDENTVVDDDEDRWILSKDSSKTGKSDSPYEDALSANESTDTEYFDLSQKSSPKKEQSEQTVSDVDDGSLLNCDINSELERLSRKFDQDLVLTSDALQSDMSGSKETLEDKSETDSQTDVTEFVDSVISDSVRAVEKEQSESSMSENDATDTPLVDYNAADAPDDFSDFLFLNSLQSSEKYVTDIENSQVTVTSNLTPNEQLNEIVESDEDDADNIINDLLEQSNIIDQDDIFLTNYPRIVLQKEDSVLAKVVNVTNPSCFGVIPLEYASEIEELMKNIEEYCETAEDDSAKIWELGDLCLVVADDVWCRAQVTKLYVDTDLYQLLCVDTGKTLSVPSRDLRTIPSQLVEFPVYYISCTLADVLPLSDEWTSDHIDKFTEMCGDKTLSVHIQQHTTGTHHVYLHDHNEPSMNRAMATQYGRVVANSQLDVEIQVETMFGESPQLRAALEQMTQIAQSEATFSSDEPPQIDTNDDNIDILNSLGEDISKDGPYMVEDEAMIAKLLQEDREILEVLKRIENDENDETLDDQEFVDNISEFEEKEPESKYISSPTTDSGHDGGRVTQTTEDFSEEQDTEESEGKSEEVEDKTESEEKGDSDTEDNDADCEDLSEDIAEEIEHEASGDDSGLEDIGEDKMKVSVEGDEFKVSEEGNVMHSEDEVPPVEELEPQLADTKGTESDNYQADSEESVPDTESDPKVEDTKPEVDDVQNMVLSNEMFGAADEEEYLESLLANLDIAGDTSALDDDLLDATQPFDVPVLMEALLDNEQLYEEEVDGLRDVTVGVGEDAGTSDLQAQDLGTSDPQGQELGTSDLQAQDLGTSDPQEQDMGTSGLQGQELGIIEPYDTREPSLDNTAPSVDVIHISSDEIDQSADDIVPSPEEVNPSVDVADTVIDNIDIPFDNVESISDAYEIDPSLDSVEPPEEKIGAELDDQTEPCGDQTMETYDNMTRGDKLKSLKDEAKFLTAEFASFRDEISAIRNEGEPLGDEIQLLDGKADTFYDQVEALKDRFEVLESDFADDKHLDKIEPVVEVDPLNQVEPVTESLRHDESLEQQETCNVEPLTDDPLKEPIEEEPRQEEPVNGDHLGEKLEIPSKEPSDIQASDNPESSDTVNVASVIDEEELD